MKRTWRNWKVSLHRRRKKEPFFSRRNSSQPESAEGATDIRPLVRLCRWNVPDMSYWPVHKWTLWILPRNIHRNRGMARNRRRGASYRGNRVWAEGAMRPDGIGGIPAISGVSFSILPWDREEIFGSWQTGGRLPPFQDENRQERQATGLRTPRQGSSMKIARFTRPPCLCGIMDNVWNPPLTIFALEACSRLEENNQAYLNAPAHRVGHSTDRAFYRLPFLSMT